VSKRRFDTFARLKVGDLKHFAGHYYHVYNRGVNREDIFRSEDNYLFLLHRIKRFLPDYALSIIAYCLMPNHYHLLIRVEQDNALSPFVQRIFNSYTQAFNRQQQRSGTLFESRAKSKIINVNSYLIHIARYIHMNPVQAGLVRDPEDWLYSNYREWVGLRAGTLYDPEFVKEMFSSPQEYQSFVRSEIPRSLKDELIEYYFE